MLDDAEEHFLNFRRVRSLPLTEDIAITARVCWPTRAIGKRSGRQAGVPYDQFRWNLGNTRFKVNFLGRNGTLRP
jgi:hypothetical protein